MGVVGGMGGAAGTAAEKEAAVGTAVEMEAAAEMAVAAAGSARPQTQDMAAFVIFTIPCQYPCIPLPSPTQVCHLHCLPLRKTEC